MLQLHPILSAMRRNKVAAALIALQMAVTLAILCNALFVVRQRLALSNRPSGVDEADIFAIENQWVGQPRDLAARISADVAALRTVLGVVDAFASNTQPLSDNDFNIGITLHPDRPASVQLAAAYFGDAQALHTLGARLSAGRNFTATEISDCNLATVGPPSGILVTRALAEELSPGGRVLGRVATLLGGARVSAPIIGIIRRLQAPAVDEYGSGAAVENSILLPCREVNASLFYIVRSAPGRLDATMRAAPAALLRLSRARVIQQVQSLREARRQIYHGDSSLAHMLTEICAVLAAVTALGIVGLTSYWVEQRRHQIGIRRALGATRPGIVRHFQTENFVIAASGVVVGVALAVAANLWMIGHFAVARLPPDYLIGGAIVIVGLGQVATLLPALRAAAVPPAEATRAV